MPTNVSNGPEDIGLDGTGPDPVLPPVRPGTPPPPFEPGPDIPDPGHPPDPTPGPVAPDPGRAPDPTPGPIVPDPLLPDPKLVV